RFGMLSTRIRFRSSPHPISLVSLLVVLNVPTRYLKITEARKRPLEVQHDLPDRPIAVLCHDEIRLIPPLRFGSVELFPINEHHHIGGVFDRPAIMSNDAVC